jgi:hypothetical protein
MNIMEIIFLNLENYTTGAQFCRSSNGKGGVVMYEYNKLIVQSKNKTRTAWNVIRSLTTKRNESIDDGELAVKIEGNLTKNPKVLASAFNKYFSNAVEETVRY